MPKNIQVFEQKPEISMVLKTNAIRTQTAQTWAGSAVTWADSSVQWSTNPTEDSLIPTIVRVVNR